MHRFVEVVEAVIGDELADWPEEVAFLDLIAALQCRRQAVDQDFDGTRVGSGERLSEGVGELANAGVELEAIHVANRMANEFLLVEVAVNLAHLIGELLSGVAIKPVLEKFALFGHGKGQARKLGATTFQSG